MMTARTTVLMEQRKREEDRTTGNTGQLNIRGRGSARTGTEGPASKVTNPKNPKKNKKTEEGREADPPRPRPEATGRVDQRPRGKGRLDPSTEAARRLAKSTGRIARVAPDANVEDTSQEADPSPEYLSKWNSSTTPLIGIHK